MYRSIALVAPLLLLGCASGDMASDSAAAGAEQVSCINVTRVVGKRAEGDRALIFELSGGRTYRNDLQESCPGIARASSFGTLALDPAEGRICRNDMIRAFDPADLPVGGIKGVPRCRLGNFTLVPGR